ncbi:MAG TPA: hypothetical protein VGT60_05480 [Candidatus Limnocylindria bacterium]|nr:hypothetical protein [Candidatus Limnocylindria bacterium]
MRRLITGAMSLVLAFGVMLTLASSVSANQVAGGGYSSSYAGESVFTNNAAGETGQMSAIFFNDGTQTWAPGVVGLLICASDKVTCNVPANTAYAKNWYSQTVYATVTTGVAPGQNGFFIYDFTVPAGTPAGTVTTFYGDVGLIGTGAELRPEGYFQINTTPTPVVALILSPTSASVPVGTTQQFTVSGQPTGSTVSWSVTGGCGAVTATGLFAATAMNSASQPCSVVAAVGAQQGIAPVTVFGSPSQLACAANPTTVVANGGGPNGTAIATVALKDANGNTVSNASSPQITVSNVTPALATMTPTGSVTPSAGVATVSIATTTTAGQIQLSASATGLTGCNVIITSGGPGAATKTVSTFLTNPIAADPSSTSSLQVDVTDANGNRVISDNSTVITITRDAGSTNVCNVTGITQGTSTGFSAGGGNATAMNGRVAFTVAGTSQPGQCLVVSTTNNSSIAGSSATLTTQIVGAANKLGIISNDSPHAASNTGSCTVGGTNTDQSCTTIVVGVQDVNGSLLTTDSGRTINATPDPGTCASAGGGNVTLRASTTTSAGKATFAFSSAGAYPSCTITFSSSNVSSVNTSTAWTPGGADHLACVFTPTPLPPDNTATSNGAVSVRDAFGNVITTGTYSVSFTRTSGTTTTLLTASPQTTSGGYANFTVRANTTTGTDTYGPAMASGSLPGSNTTCTIVVQ